ncbi:TFIIB-type zinc ribbon-containing protein [Pyrodictium abyssi]|uniref:TFIIB-type domain-containing protein n=1 Tax=Pyrodictium abyssi TaxID=54256 RepID=A0ABM8ISS6_9CREN|nr:hypothetical protein PABY_01770 [Pyrodictium abyssi]
MNSYSYYAVSATTACPYCGSENLILDAHGGVLVCRSCGAVIDDTVFDAAPTPTAIATPAQPTAKLTKTERARMRLVALSITMSRRLSRLLETTEIDDILDYAKANTPEVMEVYGNACLRRLLKSFKTPAERKAALEAAITLMKGDYPLTSILSKQYGVNRRRLRYIIKRIMDCLSITRTVEVLSTALA